MIAAAEAQIALPNLFSGYATWDAMKSAVEQLRRVAPKDHDVVIKVSDVTVDELTSSNLMPFFSRAAMVSARALG